MLKVQMKKGLLRRKWWLMMNRLDFGLGFLLLIFDVNGS